MAVHRRISLRCGNALGRSIAAIGGERVSSESSISTQPQTPAALAYLLPHRASAWRWTSDAQAIEWRDGRTIAFRKEIAAVIRRLSPIGLPPLGAIVYLLAATRDNWNTGNNLAVIEKIVDGGVSEWGGKGAIQSLMPSIMRHRFRQELAEVMSDLEMVRALPDALRQNIAGKCALAELVFTGGGEKTWDASFAMDVLEQLHGDFDANAEKDAAHDAVIQRALQSELDVLRAGLGRASAESLEQFIRTGVERHVLPVDTDIPPAVAVRGLLRDLRDDSTLAGLSQLALDILAAMHIPRALMSREEIPVGGVSDISNRGPLDRLLLSELAHDGLILAIRVAMGEALYLRRESPARHPPVGRAIFIDTGIRMWGVPRLFATAVALALVASGDQRAAIQVHRNRALEIMPVNLLNREGILQHLEAFEPAPHPGPSIDEWHALVTDPGAFAERFIITHEDVLADPLFLRHLRTTGIGTCYVATVARDGTFVVWSFTEAGRKEISRAKLAVENILSPPKPKSAPLPTSGDPGFATILHMVQLPLLLPAAYDARFIVSTQRFGIIGIARGRRLVRWTGTHKGAQQLADELPPGRLWGLFVDEDRDAIHIAIGRHNSGDLLIHTVNPNNGITRQWIATQANPSQMFFRDGQLYIVGKSTVRIVTPHTDLPATVINIPSGVHWQRDRFFRSGYHQGALIVTPQGFETITKEACAGAFDRTGTGPWLLTREGQLKPSVGDPLSYGTLPHTVFVSIIAASPDGQRIVAATRNLDPKDKTFGGTAALDLDQPSPKWVKLNWSRAELPSWTLGARRSWVTAHSVNVRNRFTTIFAGSNDSLILTTRKKEQLLTFGVDSDNRLQLRPCTTPRPTSRTAYIPFVRMTSPHRRFRLDVAKWNDGSRAYLDSRGMLHLVSSDRKLPQLTLTLSNAPCAGWTSTGQTFGWSYFLFGEATTDALTAREIIREFVGRLR